MRNQGLRPAWCSGNLGTYLQSNGLIKIELRSQLEARGCGAMNYRAGNASGVLPRTKQRRALRSLLRRTKPVRAKFVDGTQSSQAKLTQEVSASIHRPDDATRKIEIDKMSQGSSNLGQWVKPCLSGTGPLEVLLCIRVPSIFQPSNCAQKASLIH